MEILELSLHSSNQFLDHFTKQNLDVSSYFDYNTHSKAVFKERAADLKNRSFQREELVSYLKQYARRFAKEQDKTFENIEKLKDPNSVVIIGGQQAGLLTGPLYTINKIISIIVLARQQEEELGIPVVPVFWIAGEDHDFAEINHIFAAKEKIPKKISVKDSPIKKQSVSELPINKQKTMEWLEEVFEVFGETDYSKQLINNLKQYVQKSSSYVEFFELVVMGIFQDQGLVLVNSGDSGLRQLEKPCFHAIVERNSNIADAALKQQQFMREQGYQPIIEIGKDSANFFYHHEGERFLVERKSEEEFFIPEINLVLSKAELHDLIEAYPEKFSNNVVTRPVMQEYLFPTLAFFAGPGEFTYWAELKQVFSEMEMKMPPVLPRLMITLLERSIERNILEASLSLDYVLQNGVEDAITAYLKDATPVEMEPLIHQAKEQISAIHHNLIQEALKIDQSLEPMLMKNGVFIQEQLEFFNRSVEKRIQEKHNVQLSKYREIELSLFPNLHPQERMWNIYYYINKYGPQFVGDLLNLSYSFNGKHKIVKI